IRTGDLASIAPDGLVRIVGRSKEMYIRGGYNVAPAEVEAVLSRHPLVGDLAIAVRPDPVMGEIGVAVVCGADAALTLEDLRRFGAEHLAAWKLPEALVFADEIPLTAMQKLDRQALRKLAAPESVAGGE
ncbi:MAG: acyl--CoA ligase, partial [Actinobacteria bacterium]|nr:acyl--CoA ligase [Actinomycetota bacterium]